MPPPFNNTTKNQQKTNQTKTTNTKEMGVGAGDVRVHDRALQRGRAPRRPRAAHDEPAALGHQDEPLQRQALLHPALHLRLRLHARRQVHARYGRL